MWAISSVHTCRHVHVLYKISYLEGSCSTTRIQIHDVQVVDKLKDYRRMIHSHQK